MRNLTLNPCIYYFVLYSYTAFLLCGADMKLCTPRKRYPQNTAIIIMVIRACKKTQKKQKNAFWSKGPGKEGKKEKYKQDKYP